MVSPAPQPHDTGEFSSKIILHFMNYNCLTRAVMLSWDFTDERSLNKDPYLFISALSRTMLIKKNCLKQQKFLNDLGFVDKSFAPISVLCWTPGSSPALTINILSVHYILSYTVVVLSLILFISLLKRLFAHGVIIYNKTYVKQFINKNIYSHLNINKITKLNSCLLSFAAKLSVLKVNSMICVS